MMRRCGSFNSLRAAGRTRGQELVALDFQETPSHSIEFSILELIQQLNCQWQKDFACCPYHATLAVIKQYLRRFEEAACSLSWSPHLGKQCRQCLIMNRRDE